MPNPLILRYREFPINKQGSRGKIGSLKPMVELASKQNPKNKILALVDSGADSSISFKQIGETYFGLNFSKEDEIPNTISGLHTCENFQCKDHPHKAKCFRKMITFIVEGATNISLNVIWIDRKINPSEDFLFILGRDFFTYFDILFKQNEEEFHLYSK